MITQFYIEDNSPNITATIRFSDGTFEFLQLTNTGTNTYQSDVPQTIYDKLNNHNIRYDIITSPTFALTGETTPPINIDYNNIGLFRKSTTDIKGDETIVEYYKNYDEATQTYSNIVVKETKTYYRNQYSLVYRIDTTIDYYYNDFQTIGYIETKRQQFNSIEGYNINRKSRENLWTKAGMYLYSELLSVKYNIIAVDTINKTFSISGNHTAEITADKSGIVENSSGNNGLYYVVSSSYDATNDKTIIVVSENILSSVADGTITFGEANAKEFLAGVNDKISLYTNGNIKPLIDAINNSTRVYMTTTIKNTLISILNISYI